jgi:uncharacterized membrane protein HdeD (DUF308 family)
MIDRAKQVRFTKAQLIGLNIALAVEFILGITLATVINFTPGKNDATQAGFLIAHIVIGTGLIIGGIARLVIALRFRMLRVVSGIGLLGMIGAFATGAVNADNGSTVMAFLMGLFFIVALAVYGYGASAVGQDAPADQPNGQAEEPSRLRR